MTPRIFIDRSVKKLYGDQSKVTDEIIDLYYDLVMNSANRGVYVDIFRLLKKESSSYSLSNGITDLVVPTLLMWGGEKDPWIHVQTVKKWERDLVCSKTINYKRTGHIPMEEIPLQTAMDAHEFLAL